MNHPLGAELIASYNFASEDPGEAEHAEGLSAFLSDSLGDRTLVQDDEIFSVYVFDEQGRAAQRAELRRDTLTDGSTTVNLVIVFER